MILVRKLDGMRETVNDEFTISVYLSHGWVVVEEEKEESEPPKKTRKIKATE